MTAMARTHRLPRAARPHAFVVDELTPADPYTGLACCQVCRKPGRPGDAQHPTTPDAPVLPAALAAAARDRDAAILGERLGERDET